MFGFRWARRNHHHWRHTLSSLGHQTLPATPIPRINTISEGDPYTLTSEFTGSFSDPGDYLFNNVSLTLTGASGFEFQSDFDSASLTITLSGTDDGFSMSRAPPAALLSVSGWASPRSGFHAFPGHDQWSNRLRELPRVHKLPSVRFKTIASEGV
jgi:hypothetical protein